LTEKPKREKPTFGRDRRSLHKPRAKGGIGTNEREFTHFVTRKFCGTAPPIARRVKRGAKKWKKTTLKTRERKQRN